MPHLEETLARKENWRGKYCQDTEANRGRDVAKVIRVRNELGGAFDNDETARSRSGHQ
jgi:hypothetical protein